MQNVLNRVRRPAWGWSRDFLALLELLAKGPYCQHGQFGRQQKGKRVGRA